MLRDQQKADGSDNERKACAAERRVTVNGGPARSSTLRLFKVNFFGNGQNMDQNSFPLSVSLQSKGETDARPDATDTGHECNLRAWLTISLYAGFTFPSNLNISMDRPKP